jgi:hypothetical protein
MKKMNKGKIRRIVLVFLLLVPVILPFMRPLSEDNFYTNQKEYVDTKLKGAGFLNFIQPNSSTRWEAGKYHTLLYESQGTGYYCDFLLYKGGKYVTEVAESVFMWADYHTWKIPINLIDGKDYTIRVYSTSERDEYIAESDEFEIFGGEGKMITILSPNDNQEWQRGSRNNITWETLGEIDYVDISLYRKGELIKIIASNVYDDGRFSWKVPHTLLASAYYQIKIKDTESQTYAMSIDFKIFGIDQIQIISPENDINWKFGGHKISWNWFGGFNKIDIKLYKEGSFFKTIGNNIENKGVFYWKFPDTYETSDAYEIRIYSTLNSSVYDTASFKLYNGFWDSLSIKRPNINSHWRQNSTHQLIWDSVGQISYIDLILYKEKIYIDTIIRKTPNDGSYNWTIPSYLLDDEKYSISIFDHLDSKVSSKSNEFKISTEGNINDSKGLQQSAGEFPLSYLPLLLTGLVAIPCAVILIWQDRKLKRA